LKSEQLYKSVSIVALFLFLSATCNVTFNGGTIPAGVETIAIDNFPNQSNFVSTTLSQTFTESLKDKFLRETKLTLADTDADWELSGAITGYQSSPIAPTGNETTALNRLTITVKVDFVSKEDEEANWTQSFSRYEDYESTKTLQQVEAELNQKISDQIADDIYQKLTQNW